MAIFTSALTSTATSPATSYNPNLRLEYGKAAEGEDVLMIKVKLQRGAANKPNTLASLAGPYGICGNILRAKTGAYMLSLQIGGFAYDNGSIKLQNGAVQPKGSHELLGLPARTFPEGKIERISVASPRAEALRQRLVLQNPADFLSKIVVAPGSSEADAIVAQLKTLQPGETANIDSAYGELCGSLLSRKLVTPQDWDEVVSPLTGELYSRIWQEIPAELAEHIIELDENVEPNADGKPGAWNASLTLHFRWADIILLEPKVRGLKRGGDITPYTLNGNVIQERSLQLPLLSVMLQSEVYKPVNPFRAVPVAYAKGIADAAYASSTPTPAGRDMSDVEERWALNQDLLQEFGSISGGKKKVQAKLAQIVAKAEAGQDVAEEVAVVKALVADPAATHYTPERVHELLDKPLAAIEEGGAPVVEETPEVFVPMDLGPLMDALS
jgi:hypothetical protein